MAAAILIEAAVDSAADAERAVREGAGRLEVCGDLGVGGLTPSAELLRDCLSLGVPCVAMARPRKGNFVFTGPEIARMTADAKEVLATGAHGVVFGSLTPDRTVDAETTRAIVKLAKGSTTVFHRAFDKTPDADRALDALIECGVTRVLTSGHAPVALEGVHELASLVSRAEGRITILPGGTVRATNVRMLVDHSGATEVHARATTPGVIAGIRNALSH